MDEYDKKFNEMQKYIPFLESLIAQNKDKPQHGMSKLQHLYQTLTNNTRRLKIETLERCENVLQKLWNKCDKGNSIESFAARKNQENVPRTIDITKSPVKLNKPMERPSSSTSPIITHVIPPIVTIEETENESAVHRNTDDTPLSPDPCDEVMLISPDHNDDGIQVIASTKESKSREWSSRKHSWDHENESWEIPRAEPMNTGSDNEMWDISEEAEEEEPNTYRDPTPRVSRRLEKTWKPSYIQDYQDVTVAAKAIADKLSKKKEQEMPSRPIPTVSVPSLEGSRRVTTFIRQKLQGLDTDSHHHKSESIINVPDSKMISPEPEVVVYHKSQLPSIPPPPHIPHRKMSPSRMSPPRTPTTPSSPVPSSSSSSSSFSNIVTSNAPSYKPVTYDKEKRPETSLQEPKKPVSIIDSILNRPPLSDADLKLLLSDATEAEVNKEKGNEQMEGECAKFEKELHKVTEDIKKLNAEVTHSHKESKHSKKHHSKSKDEKHRHEKDRSRERSKDRDKDKEKHSYKKHSSFSHRDKEKSSDKDKSSSSDKNKLCSEKLLCNDTSLNSDISSTSGVRVKSTEILKPTESKVTANSSPPVRIPSPLKSDKCRVEREKEIRYSDNYERHSRQRDNIESEKPRERISTTFISPSESNSNILVIRPSEQPLESIISKGDTEHRNDFFIKPHDSLGPRMPLPLESSMNKGDNERRNDFFNKPHDNMSSRIPLHHPPGNNEYFGGHNTPSPNDFAHSLNAPKEFSKTIPSLMSTPIRPPTVINSPVMSSPLPPNDYCSPNNVQLTTAKPPNDYCGSMNKPPMSSDFMNQQWNAGNNYMNPVPPVSNPYQMNSNMMQDSWNRGPVPTPIPTPVPPPEVRPMNDHNRGNNQYNNAVGMMSHNMPSNTPYASYMNYQQPEPQLRPLWESNSIRPNDIHVNRSSPASNEGFSCRPADPFTRPNTPWGMSRGDPRNDLRNDLRTDPRVDPRIDPRIDPRSGYNRDNRDVRFGWDPRKDRDPRTMSDRDPRTLSDRDPRIRANKPPSPTRQDNLNSNRFQRQQKEITAAKPKIIPSSSAASSITLINAKDSKKGVESITRDSKKEVPLKNKNKFKLQKNLDSKNKRNMVNNAKKDKIKDKSKEKLKEKKSLEVMHSPLESLYGVVDTSAWSTQGYGIQKFKIPKIKRPKSPLPSPLPPSQEEETENWDDIDEESMNSEFKSEDNVAESTQNEHSETMQEKTKEKMPAHLEMNEQLEDTKVKISEEWLKSYVKKIVYEKPDDSFTAELVQKIKNYFKKKRKKKVKKGLISESSSSSSKEDDSEDSDSEESQKKKKKKKIIKRRVISSDSSEEETLAERLSELKTFSSKKHDDSDDDHKDIVNDEKTKKRKKTKKKKSPKKMETDSSKSTEVQNDKFEGEKKNAQKQNVEMNDELNKDVEMDDESNKNVELKDKSNKNIEINIELTKDVEINVEPIKNIEMHDKQSKSMEKNSMQNTDVQLIDDSMKSTKLLKVKNSNEVDKLEKSNDEEEKTKEDESLNSSKQSESSESSKVQKPKMKRRSSLDKLHDDIRDMFICNDVITATGQRMCRLIKEGQATTNTEVTETNEVNSNAAGEEELKKVKPRKTRKTRSKKQQSKENIESSDSDLPLAKRNSETTEDGAEAKETQNEIQKSLKTSRKKQKSKVSETMKEPRIMLEKTDISKLIESSKLLDSSSDESLGIDASELVAAVDISLHRKLRSRTRAQHKAEKEKLSKEQESLSTLVDDVGSLTGDESDASNTSIASAVTIVTRNRQATNTPQPEVEDEEHLAQMLMDLVSRKTLSDKTTKKGKKKKRSNWQMGILSKKKKKATKKAVSKTAESTVEQVNVVNTDAVTEPDTDKEKDMIDKQNDNEIDPLADTAVAPEKEKKEDASSKVSKRTEATKSTKIGLNELLEYVWAGQERYKCLYCNFFGKNIVHHYAMQHPINEVLISRLSVTGARNAIEDAKRGNLTANVESAGQDISVFYCRFCTFETAGGIPSLAVEAFYEHCTTHTGEYRFRCTACPYRSVAKTSLKSHYYKVCRKNNKSVGDSINEVQIPTENCVFGYICSKCNFVQLQQENVEKHVQSWHANDPKVEVVKINMSLSLKSDIPIKPDPDTVASNIEGEKMDTSQFGEMIKPKTEKDLDLLPIAKQEPMEEELLKPDLKDFDLPADLLDEIPNEILKMENDRSPEKSMQTSATTSTKSVEENSVRTPKKTPVKSPSKLLKKTFTKVDNNNSEDKMDVDEETNKSNNKSPQNKIKSQEDQSKKNLSAFVCPPELEKHEEEIQLERQKKMNLIADHMGIKVNSEDAKKKLSIADKLKDKMETNIQANSTDTSIIDPAEQFSNSIRISSVMSISSSNDEEKIVESAKDTELPIDSARIKSSPPHDDVIPTIKTEKEDEEEESADKINAKLKDPLVGIEIEASKDQESDGETSDNNTAESNPVNYVSEYSTDLSDHEVSTDVNSLLKETTNINSPSRGLMMTTIQRLAAKLSKTSKESKESTPINASVQVKTENVSPERETLEKSSTALSSVVKNLFGDKKEEDDQLKIKCKEEPKNNDNSNILCKEEMKSPSPTREQSVEISEAGTSPKKPLIRMRRFSGDLLSVPEIFTDVNKLSETTTNTDVDNTASSIEPAFTENAEETSIKISSVVSLAPKEIGNGSDSTMANEIRKSIEMSPVKQTGVSVLKKPNQIILKRLPNPGFGLASTKTITAINPNSKETVKLTPLIITGPSTSSLPTLAPQNNNFATITQPNITTYHLNSKSMTLTVTTAKTPVLTTVSISNRASVLNSSSTVPRTSVLTPISTISKTPIITPVTKSSMLTPVSRPTVLTPVTRTSVLTPVTTMNRSAVLTPGTAVNRSPVFPNSLSTISRVPALTSGGISTVNTTSSTASNVNYKIVKVINPANSPLKQNDQTPKIAIKLKSTEFYAAMLTREKLQHLYKCMGCSCSFTTNSIEQFRLHYQFHENNVDKMKEKTPYDFQQCAYCCVAFSTLAQMLKHFEEKHTYCNFQCMYCFYRAVCQSYVEIHQTLIHPEKEKSVLRITPIMLSLPQAPIDRHSRVLPFVCENDCSKFFYVPEAFQAHLNMKHSKDSSFKCHICKNTVASPALLVMHYKIHKICKYQCLYCVFGGSSLQELHVHLSNFHYNQLPIVLERSLPPKPSKTRSAIEQLLLKNLDEISKSSDVTICAGLKPQLPLLPAPSTSSEYATFSAIPKKVYGPKKVVATTEDSLKTLYINPDTSGFENSPVSKLKRPLNLSETSPTKTCSERKRIRKEVLVPRISGEDAEHLMDISHDETQDGSEKCSITAESCSDVIDGEEFINTNLLDNFEMLQNVDNSLDLQTENNKNAFECDTNYDSDIEILEDITPTVKKDDKGEEDYSDAKVDEKISGETSSADNSNASSDVKMPNKQCLTLEDIKDTGLAGEDLYKCPYEKCTTRYADVASLKSHIKECIFAGNGALLICVHCKKSFAKCGFFLEHLKLHGLKRFGCAMCGQRFSVQYQAISHMKGKHKVNSKLIPADPKNPVPDGLYIVQPLNFCIDKIKSKKRGSSKLSEKDSSKSGDIDKISFGPNDIGILPLQAIYSREVHCAVCAYTTKVRTNIIRHLQLHAKDETVPESGPVNPVPCLDKREKMFDKMVNLASSSHQNGRMGNKTKESLIMNVDENVPKFVPENKRYVCGVPECSYLSVDEAMLRYHLKALHSDEPYFRCPHCPQQIGQETQNITIDKMGVHLKMHDTRLYKCSHCNYHHYHRHVVERHLTDKHPEKRQLMKVIRELDSATETIPEKSVIPEEQEDEQPDPDGNHWKCNLCDYKCVYKNEMSGHAASVHDEKCQFKCTVCSFKTLAKITFEQHLVSKHPTDMEATYSMVFQRIKGIRKPVESVEVGHDEPFDTTPLWRRDMPRIRHIRGILLEDEDDNTSSSEPSAKLGKRKSDGELLSKTSKSKSMKTSFLDECKSLKDKIEIMSSKETPEGSLTVDSENESESDAGVFGPYGKPNGNMFVCTLCPQFKTKYKHDMRDHLYRELKYARWHCRICGYLTVNRNTLLKHYVRNHPDEKLDLTPLSPDNAVEKWVATLLKKQLDIMKKSMLKPNSNQSTPLLNSNLKTLEKPVKVDFEENIKGGGSSVINTNEEPQQSQESSNTQKTTKPDQFSVEDPLICKHCNMKFNAWRGFKRHVRLSHLKCYSFLCPYCDRSSRTEPLMLQHIRGKHPGRPETVIPNSSTGPELTDEFWAREYGLTMPKKSLAVKQKRQNIEENVDKSNEGGKIDSARYTCNWCNYVALNLAGLKSHQRTHERILKCSYCTYSTPYRSELIQHSDVNHPKMPVKFETRNTNVSKSSNVNNTVEVLPVEDYADEIEEEEEEEEEEGMEEEDIVEADPLEEQPIYCCNYCIFCSISIEAIRTHWAAEHKDPKAVHVKQFRCRKLESTPENAQRIFKCCYCNVKSVVTNLVIHVTQHHGNVPVNFLELEEGLQEGWFCVWCKEVCDSRAKAKHHHRMFHSHLRPDYKKLPNKSYKCPECFYESENLQNLRKHVSRHINIFKCKYCSDTFNNSTETTRHNEEMHPGLESKVESILNFDARISNLMFRAVKDVLGDLPSGLQNNSGVARKSTTKHSVLLGSPTRPKAVARKSTTPRRSEDDPSLRSYGFSYYRLPRESVDLSRLSTKMTLGGHQMVVTCLTLSGIVNINPKIILKDIRR